MKKLKFVIITLGLLFLFSSKVTAGTYNFSYSGTDISASGIIITSDTPSSLGFIRSELNGYQIIDISGQRNGLPISGLAPASFPTLVVTGGLEFDNVYNEFPLWVGISYNVGNDVHFLAATFSNFRPIELEHYIEDSAYNPVTFNIEPHVPDNSCSLVMFSLSLIYLFGIRQFRQRGYPT